MVFALPHFLSDYPQPAAVVDGIRGLEHVHEKHLDYVDFLLTAAEEYQLEADAAQADDPMTDVG